MIVAWWRIDSSSTLFGVQDLANVWKLLNIRVAKRLPRSLTIGVYRRLIDPRNELGMKLHPRLLWSIVF